MSLSNNPRAPLGVALALPGDTRRTSVPLRAALVLAYVLCFLPLVAIHWPVLSLPFYWDELGQFIPATLDLLRHGYWIPHSAVPNVHPPGLEAYLALCFRIAGFSLPVARLAMLAVAAVGVLGTFLLAIRLSRAAHGAPAFLPPLWLLVSPLFYTQSFLAQLDMPAMCGTVGVLLLFLRAQYGWAAALCIPLVLTKETAVLVPAILSVHLAMRREWKAAGAFLAAPCALFIWLAALHHATGSWLGNPEFARYNVSYSLAPMRIAACLLRRIYYLFFAEFRFVGTVALLHLLFTQPVRARALVGTAEWRLVAWLAAAHVLLVSLLGGAELERYLLPVLPLFYIAVSIALFDLRKWPRTAAVLALPLGLAVNIVSNPPYPFPFENNYALIDFVELQQAGANLLERNFSHTWIATAWPLSAALRRPDFGFVRRPLHTVETHTFAWDAIRSLPPDRYDLLVTYTRTWMPQGGVGALPAVRRFLAQFYDWQPEITDAQCVQLGLHKRFTLSRRGQQLVIYSRNEPAPTIPVVQPPRERSSLESPANWTPAVRD